MTFLADTVTVIRFFTKKGKIGKQARKVLEKVDKGEGDLIISIITFVEILYLAEKKRIKVDFDKLGKTISKLDNYKIIDLNLNIVRNAQELSGLELHDRLIVSTARLHNAPILTSDKEIKAYPGIDVIWD